MQLLQCVRGYALTGIELAAAYGTCETAECWLGSGPQLIVGLNAFQLPPAQPVLRRPSYAQQDGRMHTKEGHSQPPVIGRAAQQSPGVRTSNSDMSGGPVMFHTMPVAWLMPTSSSGLAVAASAAWTALQRRNKHSIHNMVTPVRALSC
jgi:hypothetical protein